MSSQLEKTLGQQQLAVVSASLLTTALTLINSETKPR